MRKHFVYVLTLGGLGNACVQLQGEGMGQDTRIYSGSLRVIGAFQSGAMSGPCFFFFDQAFRKFSYLWWPRECWFSAPGSGVGISISEYIGVASRSSEFFRVEAGQAPAFLKAGQAPAFSKGFLNNFKND